MEKKSFSSSLKLGKFRKLLKGLTQHQRELVISCGFGSILYFDCSEAPRSVSFWLARRFDVQTRTVHLQNGATFPLNAFTVHQILGIPLGGRKICTKPTRGDKATIATDTATGTVAPTVDHLFSLLTNELTGDRFIRIFMLITLSIFLCPTSYGSASAHYYSGIACVEDIPKHDWCSFVLDWLVTSIKKFQESTSKGNALGKDRTSSLGGCLFVLAVSYFEYIKTADITLRDDIPRLKIWDDCMIQQFLALDGNSGDGHSFGMLELKDPGETPFLQSSISASSFSTLPCQIQDFIAQLIPGDGYANVRAELLGMCSNFYKELMQSCFGAIEPVLIKQMCNIAQVIWDGMSKNTRSEGARADIPGCSNSKTVDDDATTAENPMSNGTHTDATRACQSHSQTEFRIRTTNASPTDVANITRPPDKSGGFLNMKQTGLTVVANSSKFTPSNDASRHGENSGQMMTPNNVYNDKTISTESIQCAQKFIYTYPKFTSVGNDNWVSGGPSATKEHAHSKGTNAAEVLENLKAYGDDDDNSCSPIPETPVEKTTPDIQNLLHDVVPDSYERSSNVLKKTLSTRCFRTRLIEGTESANIRARKRCKRIGSLALSSMCTTCTDSPHQEKVHVSSNQIKLPGDHLQKNTIQGIATFNSSASKGHHNTDQLVPIRMEPGKGDAFHEGQVGTPGDQTKADDTQLPFTEDLGCNIDNMAQAGGVAEKKEQAQLGSPISTGIERDVANAKSTINECISDNEASKKKRICKMKGAASHISVSSGEDSDSSEDKTEVLSDKFTRRRAIRMPTDMASSTYFFDMPHHKVVVSKDERDLYHLATRRIGDKEKNKIIAQIGRFHIDHRLFGDSLRARKRVGTFAMNVFCEALNVDYTDDVNLKPSKCFLTSDIVDMFKSSKQTAADIVTYLAAKAPGLYFNKFNMVMIPVCKSNHWWAIIVNLRDHCFDVLNSYPMTSTYSKTTLQICQKFRELYQNMFGASSICDEKLFPIQVQPAPEQNTTYDCGVFAMKFIEQWDGRKIHHISQDNITLHRQKIANYILRHRANVKTIAPVKKFLMRA